MAEPTSITDVASLITAVVALGVSVLAFLLGRKERQEARESDTRRQASQVVAWPVAESSGAGVGLIIRNGSHESISDVAVFPALAEADPAATGSTETLVGKPPQDYGTIPPGTHYLRFAKDDNERLGWQGTRLVDTTGGRTVVALDGDDVTVLEPITSRHLQYQLEVFEFHDAAGTPWHRDRAGRLCAEESGIGGDRRESLRKSEANLLTSGSRPANPEVQDLVVTLSTRLCGRPLQPNEQAPATAALTALGVRHVRRTRGKGQGVELHVDGGELFYLSGDKDGRFPNDGFSRLRKAPGQSRPEKLESLNPALAGHELTASHWSGHLDDLVTAIESAVGTSLKKRPPRAGSVALT